jgi:serine/threonine protein kinase
MGALDFAKCFLSSATDRKSSPKISKKIKDLRVDIKQARLKSSEHDRNYLPYSCLTKLISKSTVQSILQSPSLEKWVLSDAKRVFAILVVLDIVDLSVIRALKNSNFNDEHLPIQLHADKTNPCPVALSESNGDDRVLNGFRNHDTWDFDSVSKFYDEQWVFLAPVFEGSKEYDLSYSTPLPFLKKSGPLGKGAFGVVYQVQIHCAHQRFFDTKVLLISAFDVIHVSLTYLQENEEQPPVAIKKLSSDLEYKTEYNILDIVREVEDDHLIKILASYQQGESNSYLMFKWADGGNLDDFWMTSAYGEAPITGDLVRWCLTQMKGLAGAIDKLHNFDQGRNIRHGDLKPQNILHFKEKDIWGNLQIADMGQTKIHSMATDLRLSDKNVVTGTSRYNSPEASTNATKGGSRSDDMWAIGCIFLEFVIWALCGSEELDVFTHSFPMKESYFLMEGTTENPQPQTFRLQNSVHIEIGRIRDLLNVNVETGRCISKGLRDLLDFIVNELLIIDSAVDSAVDSAIDPATPEEENTSVIVSPQIVVQPPQRTTSNGSEPSQQTPSSRRARAKRLSERLEEICAHQSSSYYFDDQSGYARPTLLSPRRIITVASNYLSPTAAGFRLGHQSARRIDANTEASRNSIGLLFMKWDY